MADPQTTNKFLNQPTRGSDVGTWDTPVNDNMGIIDNSFGGVTSIALTNSPVTLSPSQYQCVFIVLTGNLSANVAITFPNVGSFYSVQNLTANTSAFVVTMKTTVAGSQIIAAPPGEACDIMTDGTNVKYRNLGRIGSYWDYAGSSVPLWVTACTVPPYLNCDGTTFSSATYPVLTTIYGSTTLPDSRGRSRFNLNQGTGRITSTGAGFDGDTRSTGGGVTSITLSSVNIPNYSLPVTDPGHTHDVVLPMGAGTNVTVNPQQVTQFLSNHTFSAAAQSNTTGITVASGGSGTPFTTISPGYIGGITMVRAG